MKLHLPKLLRVAVLAAISVAYVPTANALTKELDIVSSSDTIEINAGAGQEKITVGTGEYIAAIVDSKVYTSFGKTNATQSVTFSSDLEITGTGQVAIGGGDEDTKPYTNMGRLFIENNKITVNADSSNGSNLCVFAGIIKDLEVENGQVDLHTGGSYRTGNSGYYTTKKRY